jgi:hypothetical protein
MDAINESPAVEVIPPSAPWEALPDGEYAIVELFGHTTLVGRITEVERFGAKMLAMEPLFAGELLAPAYHGGPAIYRLTPCARKVAWERQHRERWQLPAAIKATLPPEALPAPSTTELSEGSEDELEDRSPF